MSPRPNLRAWSVGGIHFKRLRSAGIAMTSFLGTLRERATRLVRRQDRPQDLKSINTLFVDIVKRCLPHEEAMQLAVGGSFEFVGGVELALLKHYGLGAHDYLIDVGCGSGRLAVPLSRYLRGRYLGTDLVPDLIAHARKKAGRVDWRFEIIDNIHIPERDDVADMVCLYSVLTHLTHAQSFWYLEEAKRVLRPGGRIIFSFLEFREAGHMEAFWNSLKATKNQFTEPMNVFMDRDGIQRWAEALGLDLIDIRAGSDLIVPEGPLGQSLCVLRKPD